MSLTESDRDLLASAGTTASPTTRRQAVAVLLRQSGALRDEAANVLGQSFVAATQPSFHYIPKGDAMASEAAFDDAYRQLAEYTNDFTNISVSTLTAALTQTPETLAPLRMILGFTYNELAWAMKLAHPGSRTSGGTLKTFERSPARKQATAKRIEMIDAVAKAVIAVMDRSILQVPESAQDFFHSKLDKRDTLDGWATVANSAGGVPYSTLLYQRYVGGVWSVVQNAYSEVKGDNLLEQPIADLLDDHAIPYYRSGSGASGATQTAETFGLSPGPDFVLPEESPTVIIESKIAEDGGTARDKAARIKNAADVANDRGLLPCAVVDGKGWSERPSALVDVVIATNGRTYSLSTLDHLLDIREIIDLMP
ncbi:MAG: hypothetical protein OXH63_05880 [Gemmatimonadetes bacterium]|nr:hypothetical protein [Gemmatimonadota bacterium]